MDSTKRDTVVSVVPVHLPGEVSDVLTEAAHLMKDEHSDFNANGTPVTTTGSLRSDKSTAQFPVGLVKGWSKLKSTVAAKKEDDDHLTVITEDDAAMKEKEDLQEVKARTMYRMVEELEVNGDKVRLLFLTNVQADVLARSGSSIPKLLEAFEIPSPKLVINILDSIGGIDYIGLGNANSAAMGLPGLNADKLPWESDDEAYAAEDRLLKYMEDVVLPLAAQTNAIIFMNAGRGQCVASTAFSKALALNRAKWAGALPFTVIGITGSVMNFYDNHDLTALWRTLRRLSSQWRSRDQFLLGVAQEIPTSPMDIDGRIPNLIVFDAINERKREIDKAPYVMLFTEMVRHLRKSLPCVALKAGMSSRSQGASSLQLPLQITKSGTPTIFLDTRKRSPLSLAYNRAGIIENAKTEYESFCERLLTRGVCDTHDVEAISYFHNALFGEHFQVENGPSSQQRAISTSRIVPIYQALQRSRSTAVDDDDEYRAASAVEVTETVSWFTTCLYKYAWQVDEVIDHIELEKQGQTSSTFFRTQIREMRQKIGTLIVDVNFHSMNVCDLDAAREQIQALVKLDRIPRQESQEGLLLVRAAWDEYDVCMHLSARYKFWSKLTFFLLLCIGVATVCVTVLVQAAPTQGFIDGCGEAGEQLRQVLQCDEILANWSGGIGVVGEKTWYSILFILSIASAFVLSVNSFADPTSKWRQLRSGACSVESMIWLFRTRVGEFTPSSHNHKISQETLCTTLQQWREDLVSAGNLSSTSLQKKYKPAVYKHFQHTGPTRLESGDDYHSPVKPLEYIALRMMPAQKFYQDRLPRSVKKQTILQVFIFACGAACAVLATNKQASLVVILSSVASAVTSWMEYSDNGRKIARYSSAISAIKALELWWNSLDDVEKAAAGNISHLIMSSEAIITDESRSWQATAAAKQLEKEKEQQEKPAKN